MKRITKYFKIIDFFGVSLSFTYANRPTFKTIFGSFLTLLILIMFVYKLVLSLKDLILRQNLTYRYEELPVDTDKIELKDLSIVICNLYTITTFDTQYQKHFNYEFSYGNELNIVNETKINITNKSCRISGTYKYFNNFCGCLDFNETMFKTIGKIL